MFANVPAARLRYTAAALIALMVLTRFGHFGEFSRLPDASWAVFFVGGLLLRDPRAFAAYFALAWIVDVGAMALGTPADCFSLAYLALVPAYGALWWSGCVLADALAAADGAPRRAGGVSVVAALRAVALTAAALFVAVGAAFLVSNLGFWAAGTGFGVVTLGEYAARVAGYFPGYMLVTVAYVFTALGAHLVVGRLAGAARRSA